MKNQVIEALTPEHGGKVIKYWQSHGVDTRRLKGSISAANGGVFRYYGVIDGKFANYSLRKVKDAGAEIIELPDDTGPVPTESGIQEALTRIEAKLDQLLEDKKRKEADKVCMVEDFKIGDKVRVKSWKEIKKMTEKDWGSRRIFDNGLIFAASDRDICGAEGVVEPHTNRPYIAINVNGELYAIAPQALEKI